MKRPEHIKRIRLLRKIQLFLFFFLLSFLAWLFISFSSDAEGFVKFKVIMQNHSRNNIFSQIEKIKIKTKVYYFLYYNLFPQDLILDASDIVCKSDKCYVSLNQNTILKLQKQYQHSTFIKFEKDTLFLNFKNKFQKKVKVVSRVNISPKKGFLLDNPLKIEPDSVRIFGELKLLEKINFIPTQTIDYENVSGKFEQKVPLFVNKQLVDKIYVDVQNVKIDGFFSKYTELELELPIQIFNESKFENVEIIPKLAQVRILVKLNDVDKINFQKIKLMAIYDPNTNARQKAVLKLVDDNHLALRYRVKPSYADFIIKN